jgi:hypothetical protein
MATSGNGITTASIRTPGIEESLAMASAIVNLSTKQTSTTVRSGNNCGAQVTGDIETSPLLGTIPLFPFIFCNIPHPSEVLPRVQLTVSERFTG